MTMEGALNKALNIIEKTGNKLPDPAALFALLMFVVWGVSWLLAGVTFAEIDPRTQLPIKVNNLLSGGALTSYFSQMVSVFTSFPPLGVVLVAMLGLGVAEHTGFIGAAIRAIMAVTSVRLLTPVLIMVAVLSHVAVDAGYVLVIPLGGVVFYAAGRHPLAGVAAAFMGVSGGFSATLFVPSSLDPLLSGLTQAAARLSALPGAQDLLVSPLNNYFFTTASAFLVVLIGWFITDKFVEPRLSSVPVDGAKEDLPKHEPLKPAEKRALLHSALSMAAALAVLAATAAFSSSPWRAPGGGLTDSSAPLMKSIVPLIFIFFLIPGIVYGYAAGTLKTHRDVIKGMTKSMSGMGYYIVMAFFCAQFVYAFGQSNLGALLSIKGANWLAEMAFPLGLTLSGIVLLSALVNLLVGSASAKWALIGSVMVPMLMQLGVSPDLTQAAYRVGDSSTNIITPLMPYFPLVVVFCQKYVRSTGIGTLVAIMLPYSAALLVIWTLFLLGFWWLGIPLGIGSSFVFPAVP